MFGDLTTTVDNCLLVPYLYYTEEIDRKGLTFHIHTFDDKFYNDEFLKVTSCLLPEMENGYAWGFLCLHSSYQHFNVFASSDSKLHDVA